MGTKKRTPKEIIESEEDPYLEHFYVKFGGQEMIPVTSESTEKRVYTDDEKIKELYKKHKKRYTAVHTHPPPRGWGAEPSPLFSGRDLETFLSDDKAKTMVIAMQNKISGDIRGYSVFRKTKKTPHIGLLRRFVLSIRSAIYNFSQHHSLKSGFDIMREIADKYHIRCRFIPAKGYKFSKTPAEFIPEYEYRRRQPPQYESEIKKSKDKNLESKVSVILLICALCVGGYYLFSNPNITGNVIANLNVGSSFINLILVGILILMAYLYFKPIK